MDFVSDALFDGRHFLLLLVLDHFTHECLEIVVDHSLRLYEHCFLSLVDARGRIEAWRRFCNEERPHSALAWSSTENAGPKRIP